jgi:ElaB/YqjD/DUF883 family membrane-anchored ribosome-binding protein
MDEWAKDTLGKTREGANEAVRRAGEQVQPMLDQGKSAVQDLANRASETGRQAAGQARDFMEGVAPQAKQMAGNLYEQGTRSGEQISQYVVQQPLTALLIAGAIGFILGYMIHRS